MSDLRLQLHWSVRSVLRPIRSGSVMLCKLGNSDICPIWICNPFSLLCLLRRELRDTLFASLCFRDVHREMDFSLSRSLASTKHRTDPCLIFAFCLKVASMFRKCSTQRFSFSMSYSGALYFGSDLAHFEVLHVSHVVDHFLTAR